VLGLGLVEVIREGFLEEVTTRLNDDSVLVSYTAGNAPWDNRD
jgi:hypothetical protein